MSDQTQLRDHILSPAESRPESAAPAGAWAGFKRGLRGAVLWAYPRGSWQYDLILAAILIFIFLTPRAWLRKAPTLGMVDLRHKQGIIEVAHGKESWTYLVDSRLVQALPDQKPQDAVHRILERDLQKPFTLRSLEVVRDKNGVVLAYKVVVER
jgi:hypothetical protein